MHRSRLTRQRLAALFLLGWGLFSYPLLPLFSHDQQFLGVPLLYAYVFLSWLFLIVALALIAERGRR